MSDGVVGLSEAAQRADSALVGGQAHDYFVRPGNNTQWISAPDSGRGAILSSGPFDPRRNASGLDFSEDSRRCFCDWTEKTPEFTFAYSADSRLFLREDRVHQYAAQCGPEPNENHYRDLMTLSAALTTPHLTAVNLANSGASVPQHFHTQIFPLRRWFKPAESAEGAGATVAADAPQLEENSLARVWRNLDVAAEPCLELGDVTVRQVVRPIWGLRFEFAPDTEPARRGEILHHVVHWKLRYRSRLELTYNLFVHSAAPNYATVLFREPKAERVFELGEVATLLNQFLASPADALAIVNSPNRFWRWAWLECLGGLPARDASFDRIQVFNWHFWSHIWEIISLPPSLQATILNQLPDAIAAATLSGGSR